MSDKSPFSKYGEYLSLGAEIAAGLMVPIFLGYWADTYFESSPWLLLAGCLLGIVNFFLIIFNLNKRLSGK